MKHSIIRTYITFILLFAGLFAIGTAAAQTGVNPTIRPELIMAANPPSHLSDWASQRQTVMLRCYLTQPFNQPVKLSAQVSLNGQLVAKTKPEKMPMLSLHQGLNSFLAADIIPLQAVSFFGSIDQAAQRSGILPEGNYEICVSFINAETGTPLSTAQCQPFTIRDIDPPTLISPANGMHLSVTPSSGSIGQNQTVQLNLQSVKPFNIRDLAKIDSKSLADLKAFDIISGNSHNVYYIDPKITDKDSAEAMQIPNQMNVTAPNPGGNNFASRLMEEEGIFYRFRMQDALVSGYSGSSGGDRPMESISLNFSWLPPMPAPANTPVQYKLRIVEVLPGQSSATAFNGAIPVIEKTVPAPFYKVEYLSDEYFKFRNGVHSSIAKFAWGVQATDANGNTIGKNNGWSEVRMFDLSGDPDFDLLRIRDTTKKLPNSFFDVFQEVKSEPCPYTSKKLVRKVVTPCEKGVRKLYEVWMIFTCSLQKGHSGPHHGTQKEMYLLKGTGSCNDGSKAPEGMTTEPDPTPGNVISPKDLEKIPTVEPANNSTSNTTIQTTPQPCGFTFKEKLQKVFGPWKLFKSHSQYANTYKRQIYRVYKIFTCSLWKGHGGPHHGTAITVYVREGEEKVTQAEKPADGPTTGIEPPQYLSDDPPAKDQRTPDEIKDIPDKDKAMADEAKRDAQDAGNGNADNGANGGAGNTPGAGSNGGTTVGGNNTEKEPCPYKYKYKIRSFFTPCVNGHQDLYEEWGIFNCSLHKGHSGPHHGTVTHVFVTYGGRSCDGDGGPTEPAPPKGSIISGGDLVKILTLEAANKADTAVVKVVVAKVPCPYVEKTLLRTVAGSWKRGATTVRHATYRGTTVAWADVIWTRDIWNVFSVKHCTLEKGHAGAHKLGPASEEFVKYGTITEKVTYGVGVPQVPPKPHFTDSLPQEDPK